jgi:putative transposase
MSFRTSGRGLHRAFELVRQSLLHADGLPFAGVLSVEQMQRAFDEEGVCFGEEMGEDDDEIVYTPAITFWAMLSQMLFTDKQRSCAAAVARVAVYYAHLGREICANTGAFCRARFKIPETVPQRLTRDIAHEAEAKVPKSWRWKGRTVQLADGTTHSMPDTPENQAEYPQSKSQAEGLGFPIMRVVALCSLATGMIRAAACGPYAGKETGETALLRTLFDALSPRDVLLGDRYYGGWFMLALLRERSVDFVVRLHQLRDVDFHKGRRLGKGDHVISWPKPKRPAWMDQETYDRLPQQLDVREVRVNVDIPGFRSQSLVVVTSLLDSKEYSHDDLAALYRQRWTVELRIRDIKTTMNLDVLRCKSPAMVRQELWMGLLAYNLIRLSMLQSARTAKCHPGQLSFTATMQFLANTYLTAAVVVDANCDATQPLVVLRLTHGGSYRVGNRPNRVEPRAVKRRPKQHDLLTTPRAQSRADLIVSQQAQT